MFEAIVAAAVVFVRFTRISKTLTWVICLLSNCKIDQK